MKGKILFVDDEQGMCDLVYEGMVRRNYEVYTETSALDALNRIFTEDFDVILTDINMSGMNGTELCERIHANRPDIPVVLITAFGTLETAINAIRSGAYDFVTKPISIDTLEITLLRAIEYRKLQETIKVLSSETPVGSRRKDVIGESKQFYRAFELIRRVGDSDASVFITGESGTGKELAAREIHNLSSRRTNSFVAINCAAMPENLLESELFGHYKGAFSSADRSRNGLFVQANKGTLFFDEIGDMSLVMQSKLLRALEENKIRPVGSDTEISVDVRLIAATNVDIEQLIEDGKFREDLYYRLNVMEVTLPPLRSRGNDVLLLAKHFVGVFAKKNNKKINDYLSPEVSRRLLNYTWPGNIRELRNCLERAVVMARLEFIGVEDLPEKIQTYQNSYVLLKSEDPEDLLPMAEVERKYISHVLESARGNKRVAAKILGFDRKTLYRKLDKYKSF